MATVHVTIMLQINSAVVSYVCESPKRGMVFRRSIFMGENEQQLKETTKNMPVNCQFGCSALRTMLMSVYELVVPCPSTSSIWHKSPAPCSVLPCRAGQGSGDPALSRGKPLHHTQIWGQAPGRGEPSPPHPQSHSTHPISSQISKALAGMI